MPAKISLEQAQILKDQVAMKLRYFNRLVERMTKRGFVPDDDLFRAAIFARNAVQDLHVKTHYAGIQHGVGKAGEGDPGNVVRTA